MRKIMINLINLSITSNIKKYEKDNDHYLFLVVNTLQKLSNAICILQFLYINQLLKIVICIKKSNILVKGISKLF